MWRVTRRQRAEDRCKDCTIEFYTQYQFTADIVNPIFSWIQGKLRAAA